MYILRFDIYLKKSTQTIVFQTEYKYCYDLVLHYVLHYLHKEQAKYENAFYIFLHFILGEGKESCSCFSQFLGEMDVVNQFEYYAQKLVSSPRFNFAKIIPTNLFEEQYNSEYYHRASHMCISSESIDQIRIFQLENLQTM